MTTQAQLSDSVSTLCTQLKPLGRILETPGYFAWCCAPIFDEKGQVHVFDSRWSDKLGMGGCLRACEKAHANAKNPEGPYTYIEMVLAPRPGYWDVTTCHNPHIQFVDGLYCLFYMGNSNGKTNTKRIGLATSKSLYGPWTRSDKPLLEVAEKGSWDDHCTTNPAFIKDLQGKYRLYYKSWNDSDYVNGSGSIRGNRKYGLDAYLKEPTPPYNLKRYGRLERPQLLFKNGKPAYLFNAAQGCAYGTALGFVFKITEENDANTD